MYHGGQLSEDFYVGGNEDFFDYCDKDFMSLLEVDNIVEELGYGNIFMSYQYRFLGMEIRNGLKPLMTDSDVINMSVKEVHDEMGDRVVGDGVVGEGVPDERLVDEGVKDEENDSDFIEEEFPAHEDHLHFMKFVDDHVDAQEDAVLGSRQQREEFEEEIDVDLVGELDYNSDGLHRVHEDEDGGRSNSEHYLEFNEKTDMKNPHLSLGLLFRDATHFKKPVVMHSIINGYEDVHFPRNEKFKVDATCKEAEWKHCCSKMNMKIIEGKHAEQYIRLWDFAEEIKMTNPGSTVKIKLDEGRFQMMYLCLGACKESFKHGYRPLIGLDDPNDETWVIAYSVVEIENKDSWTWFLEILQKGLIPVFLAVFPDCHHKFCVQHLYTNYREQFKGKALKEALWVVAKTTTIPHFRRAMEELRFHAIGVINYKREKPKDCMDVYYSKVKYLEIYGHLIQLMNGMSMWDATENPPIQPPLYTRQPGGPKKKRNKELSRKGQMTVKCEICKKEGHNTKTHHMHLPTKQDASSFAHGASSNPSGVPRKRGRKPKASSTAVGGNSEVQTNRGVKKRKTRQPRK
ncbi:hypothetical protein D8674_033654 [Pyrus ussuriensis x Pyrus communis]|uniref:PB1-like domain-containing protein n=1 Tax=Pyrus ussuriensis x Pyrus communis TaxID=2448454 RepID=A0A5N5HLQ1_9ROSA|nr:hypothetical protein D8674_033654 [Pyrus ussuriensis x Pyrus communis]